MDRIYYDVLFIVLVQLEGAQEHHSPDEMIEMIYT